MNTSGSTNTIVLGSEQPVGPLMFYCGLPDPLLTLHPDGRVTGSQELAPDKAALAILDWITEQWPRYVRSAPEPAAEYRIPFPLMDSIYETLKFYANLCSYQGERIGGVLKGCPRGPEPTPAQLITHAEDLLQRINREVLGRQSETKEEKS